MANLPATTKQSSTLPQRKKKAYLRALRAGYTPADIAKKMCPDNPRKQRVIRRQVHALIARTPEFLEEQAMASHGNVVASMDELTEAMIRRGKRGRMDAIRVAMEMGGIYMPHSKTSHEHSGEINIKLEAVPRPPRQLEEPIVDAEVVEDTE